MFQLTWKLDNVRRNAKDWAKISFGDVFKIKKEIGEELKRIQSVMEVGDFTKSTTLEEENCRKKWKDAISREEIFWK